jgi:hypothetical protein
MVVEARHLVQDLRARRGDRREHHDLDARCLELDDGTAEVDLRRHIRDLDVDLAEAALDSRQDGLAEAVVLVDHGRRLPGKLLLHERGHRLAVGRIDRPGRKHVLETGS